MANGNPRNPYRDRGYTATLESNGNGDFLDIRRNGTVVCNVGISVFPEGPDAEASIRIKRFVPNEFRKVSTTDDFDA